MSSATLVRQAVVKQHHTDEIGIQTKHRQFVSQLWTNKIMITSTSLLPPRLHYTDWSLNSRTSASKHHSRNATKQDGNLQRAKLKVLGNNWQKLGAAPAPLIGRRCHRDTTLSLSLPTPPKTDPKQHLRKEKLDILTLSSSGPPSSLCTSTLHGSS